MQLLAAGPLASDIVAAAENVSERRKCYGNKSGLKHLLSLSISRTFPLSHFPLFLLSIL
jgi:hypothetical protein